MSVIVPCALVLFVESNEVFMMGRWAMIWGTFMFSREDDRSAVPLSTPEG